MLVALLSVLSIFHSNCLYSVSPLPLAIIQPSNQQVILCVLGVCESVYKCEREMYSVSPLPLAIIQPSNQQVILLCVSGVC